MPPILINSFVIFIFVLARMSGLVMTAPMFGSSEVPTRIRALLAFTLALVITPVEWSANVELPTSLAAFIVSMGGELLIGMILGLGVMILLSGVQVAGQIISQMSGMSLADVFNPGFDAEVPMISNLLYLVTLTVFIILGGHRLLVGALLDTYTFLPLGHAQLPLSLGTLMATLLAESFSLAVRGARSGNGRAAVGHGGVGAHQPHAAAVEYSGNWLWPERHGHVLGIGRFGGCDCVAVPRTLRAGGGGDR